MSNKFCSGVIPGTSSRALLACLVVLGTMLGASQSVAARERAVEFSGQLNYDTFKRAAAQNRAVRISYSPGGTGAAALALARVNKVIVDGQCNSACAWSFVRNAGACFTSRASFGFHAAHDPGTGRRLNAATGYWLSTVRGSLRPRLEGLLKSSSLIRVSANEMRRYYGDRVCGAAPRIEVASKKVLPTAVVASIGSSNGSKGAKSDRNDKRVASLANSELGPWHEAFTRAAALDTAPTAAVVPAAAALLASFEINETAADPLVGMWSSVDGDIAATDRSSIGANDGRASAAGVIAMAGIALVGEVLPVPAPLDARIAALFVIVGDTPDARASFETALVCLEGSSCEEALGNVALLSERGETAVDDMITGGLVASAPLEFANRQPDSLIELSQESAGPCSADAVREAGLSKTHI